MNTGTVYPWLQQHCPTFAGLWANKATTGKALAGWAWKMTKRMFDEVILCAALVFCGYAVGYYNGAEEVRSSCTYYGSHSPQWENVINECWYESDRLPNDTGERATGYNL